MFFHFKRLEKLYASLMKKSAEVEILKRIIECLVRTSRKERLNEYHVNLNDKIKIISFLEHISKPRQKSHSKHSTKLRTYLSLLLGTKYRGDGLLEVFERSQARHQGSCFLFVLELLEFN